MCYRRRVKGARRWLGGPRSWDCERFVVIPGKPCGLEGSRFVTGRRPSSSSRRRVECRGLGRMLPAWHTIEGSPATRSGRRKRPRTRFGARRRSASLGRWKISGSRGTCAGPARMLARRPTVLSTPRTSIGCETAPWRSSARALQRAVRCTARVERRARITSQAMRRDPVMTASCRERRASDTRPGV